MRHTFEYADSPQFSQTDFVIRIPPNINLKNDLLAALASAGRFPGYFGSNWDALLDCLRDLSWIGNKSVVIVHSDLPLQNTPSEGKVYLETLRTALIDWSKAAETSTASPLGWPCVEHELRVVFPTEAQMHISRMRAAT